MSTLQKTLAKSRRMYRGESITYFWQIKGDFHLSGFQLGPETSSSHPEFSITTGPIPMKPCRLFARELMIGSKFVWGVDTFVPGYVLSNIRFEKPYVIEAGTHWGLTLSHMQASEVEHVRIELIPVGLYLGEGAPNEIIKETESDEG